VKGDSLDLGIIVTSYNTRDLLRTCLRSVYASARRRAEDDFTFEVCVVDDASSDGSAEMVAAEFPQARLIANAKNVGYPSANNQGLRAFGFPESPIARFALLLNSDTELPPDALAQMLSFMAERPDAGVAGPKIVLYDGSLDLACRRSFPTPAISFFHMVGLSRLFPHSSRFGRYNLTYIDPDLVTEVDSVMGAFMLVRAATIAQVGLMDEQFFMYGEDLDWAYRIKKAGWKIYYNPAVTVLHVKRASTRQNPRAQVEFYRAMDIFYRKHYAAQTPWWLHALIVSAISLRQRLEQLRLALASTGG
jgi:N-acetylglucosaminyl-diphospho-decaprenol L-rhamnosyltransferase